MKIRVHGAGVFGGHLAAIQVNGVTVHAVDGHHTARLRATSDSAELGPHCSATAGDIDG